VAQVLDGGFREQVDRATAPVGRALGRVGLTPDLLTGVGIAAALGAGVALAFWDRPVGIGLAVAGFLGDLLDGPVAKASQASSRRGAFFDSVSDRVADAAILGGLGVGLVLVRHQAVLGVVALGAALAASLISYQRAKAESLGFQAKGGVFERAERSIVLLAGLVIPPLLPVVLWLLLLGSLATAVQRFVRIWRSASLSPDRIRAHERLVALRRENRRRRARLRSRLGGLLESRRGSRPRRRDARG
jgi:CDP-diacylglycerol--glycerol-3-phosphate 3-phosphatidyltransferase